MSNRIIRLSCVLALICMLGICVGVTYARYSSTVSKELLFQAKLIDETGTVELTSANGWSETSNGLNVEFTLSGRNVTDASREAYVRLTATEGFDADGDVTLNVAGAIYSGTAFAVGGGNLLHAQMGSGTEYRFYGSNGEELSWQLTKSTKMELIVKGESDKALLRLVAKEK